MGLYNPLLGGVIPQPQKDSKEVAYSPLPTSNYGAKTVVAINEQASYLLDIPVTNGTHSITTTNSFILTGILVNRFVVRQDSIHDGESYNDIYLNGTKIFSFDDYLDLSTPAINQNFFIVINNWQIPANSKLYSIQTGTFIDRKSNVALFGFANPLL